MLYLRTYGIKYVYSYTIQYIYIYIYMPHMKDDNLVIGRTELLSMFFLSSFFNPFYFSYIFYYPILYKPIFLNSIFKTFDLLSLLTPSQVSFYSLSDPFDSTHFSKAIDCNLIPNPRIRCVVRIESREDPIMIGASPGTPDIHGLEAIRPWRDLPYASPF